MLKIVSVFFLCCTFACSSIAAEESLEAFVESTSQSDDNMIFQASTNSTNLPTTDGSTFGGGTMDTYTVKLENSGDLVYSRYFGGSGNENIGLQTIELDTQNNQYFDSSILSIH